MDLIYLGLSSIGSAPNLMLNAEILLGKRSIESNRTSPLEGTPDQPCYLPIALEAAHSGTDLSVVHGILGSRLGAKRKR